MKGRRALSALGGLLEAKLWNRVKCSGLLVLMVLGRMGRGKTKEVVLLEMSQSVTKNTGAKTGEKQMDLKGQPSD